MGSGYSQEDYDRMSSEFFEAALGETCIIPDVTIDKSLQKYSGMNSKAELQAYSDELLYSVPDFIEKLGSNLGTLTSIPNAVGFGALVISIVMEICLKSSKEASADSYNMLRRIFGEEKASAVRDKMSQSVSRYRTHIKNDQRLLEEIRRLEPQLSDHLITLRNSLLYDGQMSSRGFKIWGNGASFHIQMMIHEARLNIKAGRHISDFVYSIEASISMYLHDLDDLLEKYETQQISITSVYVPRCYAPECAMVISPNCILENTEAKCRIAIRPQGGCTDPDVIKGYVKNVLSKYGPILNLKKHFSDMKSNINSLINQNDVFILPAK